MLKPILATIKKLLCIPSKAPDKGAPTHLPHADPRKYEQRVPRALRILDKDKS